MSQVLEAGGACETPPPPTPFTSKYVDSPCPSDEAERFQETPRWTDLDPWIGVTQQRKRQPQPQPQPQSQLQRLEQGDLVRWYPADNTATSLPQMPREDSDPANRPTRVEIHLVHPVTPPADLSGASNGPSAPGFGGQSSPISALTPPFGCAAVDVKVRHLHGRVHQAATRSWSPPTHTPSAVTTPPRWVQPRLSATPHKVMFSPVSMKAKQQPTGKAQSVTALAGPAGSATVPLYTKLQGPPDQRAWWPNNSQALRWQRVDTWPLPSSTTAEIQQTPIIPRQGSGSGVIFGQSMTSRTATLGQHASGQLQGQLHMAGGSARMVVPCTPALSTRKEPSCCSPSLRPLRSPSRVVASPGSETLRSPSRGVASPG